MTPEQQYFLKQYNLPLYVFSQSKLLLLQTIVNDEIDIRRDVRNKELKLKLAQDVELKTGNDQGIEELKANLFLARKNYAKKLSDFDEYKYYPGYVDRDMNGKIVGASEYGESRLTPLSEATEDYIPSWQVSITREDGTEEILGVQ